MQGMFACLVHFFLALFNFILICFVPYFERRFDPNDLPNLNKISRFVLAYSLINGFFLFVLFCFCNGSAFRYDLSNSHPLFLSFVDCAHFERKRAIE